MLLLAAAIAAALAFFLVVLLTLYVQHVRRMDLFHRLAKYNITRTERKTKEDMHLSDYLMQYLKKLSAPIAERGPAQALDFKMRQAGLALLGGEFLVGSLILSALAGIGTWMLTLMPAPAFFAACFTLLMLWGLVSLRIRRRRNAFTEQLGDCLNTVANALRAGYSFQQAMDVIAKEMEPPISEEFAQVSREVSMGVLLETSLESMNQRIASSDFDLVVTAVLIQREVGGNLAQILDNISDTINERIRMKREIKTLTAQGRLSAWVLLLLPFAIAGFMYVANPSQIMTLITHPLGRMALGVAFVLEIFGYLVIRRIVNIEL